MPVIPNGVGDEFESRLPNAIGDFLSKSSTQKLGFFYIYMKHYVYIIYSENFDKYYKGYTTHPQLRLQEHNDGLSRYTKHFTPWKLVFLQSFETKTEALIRERKLKKYSKEQIKDLANSSKNEINDFSG